jgi:hypothetical protein
MRALYFVRTTHNVRLHIFALDYVRLHPFSRYTLLVLYLMYVHHIVLMPFPACTRNTVAALRYTKAIAHCAGYMSFKNQRNSEVILVILCLVLRF